MPPVRRQNCVSRAELPASPPPFPYAVPKVSNQNPSLHFAVVLNSLAGRGLASRDWPQLEGELRARGIGYELLSAGSGPEALARVQTLPPEMPVMAVGGDGTVGALLPAFVGTGRPLAIMPLGSGNDYAGMLGLKPEAFDEALSRLRFKPRLVDALQVSIVDGDAAGTTRVLLNGMGMGFDAQVNDAMLRAPKQLSGFGRYAWGAAMTVRDLKLVDLDVVVDGEPLYHGPSCLCAVMNGTRYGGGFLISPASDARDGKLNVLCSGPVNRTELVALMLKVLGGKHLNDPKVHHRPGTRVVVRWAQPVHLHLDGDAYGKASEVHAQILPGAIKLLNG